MRDLGSVPGKDGGGRKKGAGFFSDWDSGSRELENHERFRIRPW